MVDRVDRFQEAEDEYASFDGTEVGVREVRVWLGAPHFRYVTRLRKITDLGKPKKVEPSDATYIPPFLSEGKVRKTTNGDRVEDFLNEYGPQKIQQIHHSIGMSRSSLEYACKSNPNIVRMEDGRWTVA